MPRQPDPNIETDESTVRLFRGWLAELRQQRRVEEAEEERLRRSRKSTSDGSDFLSWLTGDGDADGGGD